MECGCRDGGHLHCQGGQCERGRGQSGLLGDSVEGFGFGGGTGSGLGFGGGAGSDSGAKVGTNVFTKYNGFNATAALGSDLGFYSISRPTGTTSVTQTVKTQFLQGAAGSTGDVWNLSATGQLTYTATAAVPEADSWAMAMLGLGLMGFVARRRTRA